MSAAQIIYTNLYGTIDDKRFKADKIADIEGWLAEGDKTITNVHVLTDEFLKYDIEDYRERMDNP